MSLKDIAKELGISPSTVSRVVNQKKNFSVSPELREKILARASSSGFTPNPVYQAMRQKKNKQIAILQPNMFHIASASNISAGIDSMCDFLLRHGFSFLSLNHIIEFQRDYQLPAWKVAGALVVDVRQVELIAELDTAGVSYVSLNGVSGPNGTAVMTDDYANMMMILNYLRDLGHKRIAYINFYRPPDKPVFVLEDHHYSVLQRLAAYQDFCREIDWEPLKESLDCEYDTLPTVEAGLKRNCTAFVSYHFAQGVEAIFHLKKRNLRVPEDISVASFNNPALAEFIDPPLTCIDIPVQEMGQAAGELLLKKYEDSSWRNGETVMFKGKLLQRQSTGPCKK